MSKIRFNSNESINDFIYRIGNEKKSNADITWSDVSDAITEKFDGIKAMSPNACRKKFASILKNVDFTTKIKKSCDKEDKNINNSFTETITEKDKKDLKIAEELRYYKREAAKYKRVAGKDYKLAEEISNNINALPKRQVDFPKTKWYDYAIYALVSDIHMGLDYKDDNPLIGTYNPEIATQRLMYYASEIVKEGRHHSANICYVSFMGDLIHGGIHESTVRESSIGVSKQASSIINAMCEFLLYLSQNFEKVYVNSVGGNHSRISPIADTNRYGDYLDTLCYDTVKERCNNQENLMFINNDVDPAIGHFTIFGKNYYSVHGDADRDLKNSAARIEGLTRKHVDVLVSGHMHHMTANMGSTMYIQNGCMCGSGSEYDKKHKFFSPACQTILIVNTDGVRAMLNIQFSDDFRRSGIR